MGMVKALGAGFLLWYLRVLSKLQIKKINPLVIGIGGASGKSSVSHLLGAVLSTKYKVKQGFGRNSETGIPLNILGISPKNYAFWDWAGVLFLAIVKVITDWKKYDIYIAEMGIDGPNEPKNMSYLLKIVKPRIAALTNITWEHSVYFDEVVKGEDGKGRANKILERTGEEEIKLLKFLGRNDFAIINVDDLIIKSYEKDIKASKITISLKDKKADFYGSFKDINLENFSLDIIGKGKTYNLSLGFPLPPHYAFSFLIVVAIAYIKGIPVKDSLRSLKESFSLPPGRFSLFKGIKNTTIIDSSYNNATITPIVDILEFIQKAEKNKRKVGIIGDMRELGSVGKLLHEELAEKIAASLDVAFLIGDSMVSYAFPKIKNRKNIYAFKTFTQAREKIMEEIKDNDLILIKGSQNKLFLERAVEMLLLNSQDKRFLCRRGEFWNKKRKETL